jgi:hypothetical protein
MNNVKNNNRIAAKGHSYSISPANIEEVPSNMIIIIIAEKIKLP